MDADRNLLFGVLALQLDLIDSPRFAEACAAWAARKDQPLGDLLVERGWITATDREEGNRVMGRKLEKAGGDARNLLGTIADATIREVLDSQADEAIRATLTGL